MRLGLAIPLLNESASVAGVVGPMHECLTNAGVEHTLVLVNNGSTDGTRDAIEALAKPDTIVPIHLRENAGYGGGILTGLAHLERNGLPDVVGWAWGDGQIAPSAVVPLLEAIRNGADLAKTVRTARHDGALRRAVTTGYSATMRILGSRTRDVNGCPKLMTREAFLAIEPTSVDWFIDAELVLSAERMGLRIAEHPVTMTRREHGESKVTARTVAEFAKNLAAWTLRRG